MINLPVDSNSRAIQCAPLGNGYNFSAGEILPEEARGFLRFKNIGSANAVIRLANNNSDGVIISPAETEYFFVDDTVEIIQGTVNVMY